MTKKQYGILASVAGAAFATWWYKFRTPAPGAIAPDRGETIFRNTPQPAENDALGG